MDQRETPTSGGNESKRPLETQSEQVMRKFRQELVEIPVNAPRRIGALDGIELDNLNRFVSIELHTTMDNSLRGLTEQEHIKVHGNGIVTYNEDRKIHLMEMRNKREKLGEEYGEGVLWVERVADDLADAFIHEGCSSRQAKSTSSARLHDFEVELKRS